MTKSHSLSPGQLYSHTFLCWMIDSQNRLKVQKSCSSVSMMSEMWSVQVSTGRDQAHNFIEDKQGSPDREWNSISCLLLPAKRKKKDPWHTHILTTHRSSLEMNLCVWKDSVSPVAATDSDDNRPKKRNLITLLPYYHPRPGSISAWALKYPISAE